MITFTLVENEEIPWDEIEASQGANIFHTRRWFSFLENALGLPPVIARIRRGGETLGYFQGAVDHKFGLKILGSPFRGWSSEFMGLNLQRQADYPDVLRALPDFAFSTLGCHYLEMIDPRVPLDGLNELPFRVDDLKRHVIDLTQSEEALFNNMDRDRRSNVRRAERLGVRVELANDAGFVDDYHAMLVEVFSKQSLQVPYSKERVRQLIDAMGDSNGLMRMRARDANGEVIAAYIGLAHNGVAVGWGASSRQKSLALRPNEACYWAQMKYWKAQGMRDFHIGGGWGSFKRSYGSFVMEVPRLRLARNPALGLLLDFVFTYRNPRLRNWLVKNAHPGRKRSAPAESRET